jgi:hypothetical protein
MAAAGKWGNRERTSRATDSLAHLERRWSRGRSTGGSGLRQWWLTGGGATSFGREVEVAGERRGAVESDDLAFYRPEVRGEAVGRWLAQASSQEHSNGG